MASAEYKQLLAAIEDDIFAGDESFEEAYEKLQMLHGHPIADNTEVVWRQINGVRIATVRSDSAIPPTRTLMFCHGGAFIAANGDGYLFYAEMLSSLCRATVILVDYRLAPEHQAPAAHQDCLRAYQGLLEEGLNPARLALIGDSCGGGMALATLLAAKRQGLPMAAAAVSLGGWFDLSASFPSATAPAGRDPFANARFTRARGLDYLGADGDLKDPRYSVAYDDPTGLPALLLQVGQVDLTRDEALAVAQQASKAGVAVTVEVWPEMVHGFQGLASAGIPESLAAMDSVNSFLDRWVPANG